MAHPTDPSARILVVDDEPTIRNMLAEFLGLEGYTVHTAEDGTHALDELSRHSFDLVLTDLKMPRMGGLALLEAISRTSPDVQTIMMTGFGTVETAIEAMKRGAYDYILKPFKLDEVVRVVSRGLEKRRIVGENMRLRETVSLYKVSEAIAASLSLEQVLETVAQACMHDLGADLASTWLDDTEGGYFERLRIVAPHFADPAALGSVDGHRVGERFRGDAPLLEQGAAGLPLFGGPPELPLVSLMAAPLRAKHRLLGSIVVASFTPGHRYSEGQRKLLSLVASRTAAAIENARLYEDLRGTFQQTIEGLAKAIDKMDRYTAGHSDRVASLATYMAEQLGLSPSEIEIVRQSALMHDIGKIGCVLNLNKPGRLSAEEYEAFKQHPGYGRDILEPIRFLHPLIPGVHLHHERWDGRGYPLQLAGERIPLIARLISVADTYDAMTSDRAYRQALPHEVALAEIDRCSGSQFDPSLAGSFARYVEQFRERELAAGRRIPE